MNISHPDTAERRGDSAHRPGGINFISHLKGNENKPDSFDLMTVFTNSDYYTPRHRHNFDQIRIMLKGSFQWNPNSVQQEGMVGYFTEGTMYTQKGLDDSATLLLQVGGASGEGYMNYDQMQAGIRELQRQGEFREGIYEGKDASGNPVKRDGYEAIWEYVFGRKIEYPKPRYEAPVMLWPDRFDWAETDNKGVHRKNLGVFNERGLELAQWRLQAGAGCMPGAGDRPSMLYFLSGDGWVGAESYRQGTAVYLDIGETAELQAKTTSELYLFGLPTFDRRVTQSET